MEKIELKAKNNSWMIGVSFFTFLGEIYFKSHLIKRNHIILRKNKVDTYGAPVFVPDCFHSQNVYNNSYEQSMYIRSLWVVY